MPVLGCGAQLSKLMDVSDQDVATIEDVIAERIGMGVSQAQAQRQAVDEAIAQLGEERSMVMKAIEEQLGPKANEYANPGATQQIKLDPETQSFVRGDGGVVSYGDLSKMLGLDERQQDSGGTGVSPALAGSFYSRSASKPTGLSTTASVRDAITQAFPSLNAALDRMLQRGEQGKRGGLVVIADNTDEAIAKAYSDATRRDYDAALVDIQTSGDGTIQGFYDAKSGIQFLVAPNVTADNAAAVALHEAYHGQESKAINAKAQALIDSADSKGHTKATREVLQEARQKMEDAGEAGNDREAAAYIIESAAQRGREAGFSAVDGKFMGWVDSNIGKRIGGLVRDFVAMVRAHALRMGVPLELSVDDLVAYAKLGIETASRGTTVGGDGVLQSEKMDRSQQTESPAFRKWFGASRVVDADGKPLIMYHGTNKSDQGGAFTQFDAYGSNYGLFGQGQYFTDTPEVASSYTTKGKGDAPTVYPAYLSIENPIDMDANADAAQWGAAFPDVDFEAYTPDKLTNEGYYRAVESSLTDGDIPKFEGAEIMQDGLRKMGYDGIVHIGGGRVKSEGVRHQVYIAFDPEQIKSATGNRGTFDASNPDIRYSRASGQAAPAAPTKWAMPESKADAFLQKWVDGRVDLKRAQEAIAQFTKREIPETADAQLAATLYAGRVSDRAKTFLAAEVKPLFELMHKHGVDQLALSDYLLARHAPERNAQIAKVNPKLPDGGAGANSKGVLMTTQAAKDYMAALTPGQRIKLDLVAKQVDDLTKGTRDLLVAEGLESKEAIASWEGAYKHYVPLFKDEVDEGMYSHPTGSGFTAKGNASKRAMGSEGEVTNMISHVLAQREAAITRAEKNRVSMSLYALALESPNADFFSVIRPNMKDAAIEAALQAMGADPAAIAGMQRAPTIQVIDKSTGQVRKQVNPMYKNLPNAVVLKVAGQDRVVLFNDKNEQARRLVENLRNLDPQTLDVINKVGHATRFIASMATQYNPAFGLVNVVRDIQGSLVNMSGTPIANKRLKVLSQLGAAGRGIAADLASDGANQGEWAKLYRQFREDGGQTGFMDMVRDPFERTKNIAKELENLDRATAHPAKVAKLVLGALDGYNTTLENSVRLSVYKTALDAGQSRAKAAKIAREITVDFNRKGAAMKGLSPLYAFANAAVQGTARTLETLSDPKTAAVVITGGLMVGALQAFALAAAGYDDDEIAEFEKARALIIPLGADSEGKKQFFKIPMPLGLHVLPNTGRVAMELAMSDGKDAGKKVWSGMGQIAGAFNPLGGGDITTAHGLAATIAPTVLDPLVDLAMNENFAGNTISNTRRGADDMRPGFSMARESTVKMPSGGIYTGVAKALNDWTGGNDFRKGGISPTPEQVRYATMAIGGGLLREIEKGTNAAIKSGDGKAGKSSEIPAMGRFYGEVDADQIQRTRYHDNADKVGKLASEMQQLKKGRNAEGRAQLAASEPLTRLTYMDAAVQRNLSNLNRKILENVDNAPVLAQLEKKRLDLMGRFNDRVKQVEKEAAR